MNYGGNSPKMNPYDVLSRMTTPFQSILLEASAGTGKTFSIENLVVRLLTEEDPLTGTPCKIEEILVVTFTKAATRELKKRIRSKIDKALQFLESEIADDQSPDYLQAIFEDPDTSKKAKERLERALASFDEAQIFTIHGYCTRMLSDYSFELGESQKLCEMLSKEELNRIVRDYLRTRTDSDTISEEQLKSVIKLGGKEGVEGLIQELIKNLGKVTSYQELPSPIALHKKFQNTLQECLQNEKCDPHLVFEDFIELRKAYKKFGDHLEEKAERFFQLWKSPELTYSDIESVLRDDLVIVKSLDSSLLKAKYKDTPPSLDLHYPGLFDRLRRALLEVYEQCTDSKAHLTWIVLTCYKLYEKTLIEEEKTSNDFLLKEMNKAVDSSGFVKRIQDRYSVAIVDEFQDTDPLQWHILNKLFLDDQSEGKHLILVGDPKQAIYAFRQADIYTYMLARESFSQDQCLSLSTNFRSTPKLIAGINALFSEENNPGLIRLPITGNTLPYPIVKAGKPEESIHDAHCRSIHFLLAKSDPGKKRVWPTDELMTGTFLPRMVNEIIHLIEGDHVPPEDIAILVRTKHQAEQALSALKHAQIPAAAQRQKNLNDSPYLITIIEWFRALLEPNNLSFLFQMLGGALFNRSVEDIIKIQNDPKELSRWVQHLQDLRQSIYTLGIASAFQLSLNLVEKGAHDSILNQLLAKENGCEAYRDLTQLIGYLSHVESAQHATPETLLDHLIRLPGLSSDDESKLKILNDPDLKAVKVMTMHISKGLEFPYVFALGLCSRFSVKDKIIRKPGTQEITPLDESSDSYLSYCYELEAENIRLAYVAMTRAKNRLYIPFPVNLKNDSIKPGEASAAELLLSRLGKSADEPLPYHSISQTAVANLCQFVDTHQESLSISYEWVEPSTQNTLTIQHETQDLIEPKQPSIYAPRKPVHSFTSLSSRHEIPYTSIEQSEDPLSSKIDLLPAGAETGILIHTLFEQLDFSTVKEMTSPYSLLPLLEHMITSPDLQNWKSTICEMIYNTLKTPLMTPDGELFSLCDIPSTDCYKEMDFLYPWEKQGFCKGTIDLVFSYRDRYYLLDWKSNKLDAYDHEHLSQAMEQHQYDLQAKIYSEALQRYLTLTDSRNIDDCFGGIFYLFTRGVHPSTAMSSGVYFMEGTKCLV